jgi:CheY-like chemotaxis protein
MQVDRLRPILLVEDEADDVAFVTRALDKTGIANPLIVATTASDARAALERMSPADYPSMAVVDIHLPGQESGLEFLAWLRQAPGELSSIPALVYSVSDRPEHQAHARVLGAMVFMRKPVTEQALSQAVQALGFVITTTVDGGRVRRVIEPRYFASNPGR